MKKVLAVSGGIDSITMLDIFASRFNNDDLVVATFDHGTRQSSKTDVEFVSKIAKSYGLRVYIGSEKLGENISEEKAREARYVFLRKIAFEEKGEIFTAHHLDDLIETTVINFLRGTGIRGLAGLSTLGIRRPFIDGFFSEIFDKRKILKYAAKNKLIFREDPTNSSDDYLRNRIRQKVFDLNFETKQKIFELWKKQKADVFEIEKILENILPENQKYERAWFFNLDEKISLEILREALMRARISATRPQILEFLNAIKTYLPGKKFNLPSDRLVKINKKDFEL